MSKYFYLIVFCSAAFIGSVIYSWLVALYLSLPFELVFLLIITALLLFYPIVGLRFWYVRWARTHYPEWLYRYSFFVLFTKVLSPLPGMKKKTQGPSIQALEVVLNHNGSLVGFLAFLVLIFVSVPEFALYTVIYAIHIVGTIILDIIPAMLILFLLGAR
jgi:hypothetical protein